ncbi:UNVERIFIED_CONTAM: hypothetical protein Scaly_0630800 [Sesamum calycinum]|uniref:O-fucosyltransferase family protein n=1 Tax=Sesamum calycinum TaxID=2727403 RepID=A0AAW2RT34_9LAMI
MAIQKTHQKVKLSKPRSPIFVLTASVACIALLYLVSSLLSTPRSMRSLVTDPKNRHSLHDKYLYWGSRIDCPGKHCDSCEGLGHQESSLSLRFAGFGNRKLVNLDNLLEWKTRVLSDLYLGRTFVMPSRMCINPIHNKKGILSSAIWFQRNDTSHDFSFVFKETDSDSSLDVPLIGKASKWELNILLEIEWAASSCAMDSLYDLDLISDTIPVILDNSKMWHHVLTTSMKLGSRGIAHVQGVSRADLKEKSLYSNLLLINRTASPLSWFMECKDRNNRSSIMLPYSFLPSMAAKKLRDAAEKIMALLGDYDAIHVRRGDKLKTRKDRFGVERSLHPHLDRDTRPEFILCRIAKWVPAGRTLFIASNERTPGFFSPLAVRYKLAYTSNYSSLLDPLVENNYQLFMVERLIMMGAKTFIRTFKEDDADLSLTDDPKKNTKIWHIPVYTKDGDDC